MVGVILCGGRSTRMGTDKGLIKIGEKTWAKTAFDKLYSLGIPVIVSINATQRDAYSTVFDSNLLFTDIDALPVEGPLQGLLSMHLHFPKEDLLLLACDLPLMEKQLLQQLKEAFERHPAADCYFTNNGSPEPVCAVYAAATLRQLLAKARENKLAHFGLRNIFQEFKGTSIEVDAAQQGCFKNFNSPAELDSTSR